MFKSFDPAIPLLGTHPTDILVQNVSYVCIRSLFVALFLIRLEIFKYSSMGDWLSKLWYIHTYATVKKIGVISKIYC